jgi:septum site-determining protein MinC
VTQPVRSGQQVYAKDADLIILASVGTGAELLADGHIHVYGTLRGRALAGIQGDEQARIFCSQLQAELVSIAGQYRMPDPNDLVVQGAKQIFLEQNKIQITDL